MICPSDDTLDRWLQDGKTDSVPGEALAHLVSCTSCRDRVGSWGRLTKLDEICGRRGVEPDGLPASTTPADGVEPKPDLEATETYQPAPIRKIGNYDLLRKIGRGGGGEVYEALHTLLHRRVAVKILSAKHAGEDHGKHRFFREMEAIGRLNHPHIVQAFDAGDADGELYLAMELIDGPDTETLARRVASISVPNACEIVRQAALGVQHAHEQGFVHRDLKPSNLLLSSTGVKVADLGMVLWRRTESDAEDLTGSCVIMGTGDYMAPEQSDGAHHVDIRADIYSLGCTLYRLLAGRPPFASPIKRSVMQKLMDHVQLPVPDVAKLRPDVPADLKAILENKLLAKDRNERFSRPQEIANALAPFCVGADLRQLLSSRSTPKIVTPTNAGPVKLGSTSVPAPTAVLSNQTTAVDTACGTPAGIPRFKVFAFAVLVLCIVAFLIVGWMNWPGGVPVASEFRQENQIEASVNVKGPEQLHSAKSTPVATAVEIPAQEIRRANIANPRGLGLIEQRWQNVFGMVPAGAVWPGQSGLGSWHLDDNLKALVFQSENTFRFVKLGEIKQGDREQITIKVDCHCQSVTGDFGIFLGFRPPTNDRDLATRFQGIEVVALNEPSALHSARVLRCAGILDGKSGLIKRDNSRNTEILDTIVNRQDWNLEIQVDGMKLRSVRLCSQECFRLCDESINVRYTEVDFVGDFGLYCKDGAVYFRNPKLERKPSR